jgi:hypothetical protein
LLVSWLAEALVGIAVVVVTGWAVGADSSNPDVLRLADALLSDVAEEFIHSLAWHHTASFSVLIIGLTIQAFGAGSLDDVVSLGAVTFATVEVVDLVASALHSA